LLRHDVLNNHPQVDLIFVVSRGRPDPETLASYWSWSPMVSGAAALSHADLSSSSSPCSTSVTLLLFAAPAHDVGQYHHSALLAFSVAGVNSCSARSSTCSTYSYSSTTSFTSVSTTGRTAVTCTPGVPRSAALRYCYYGGFGEVWCCCCLSLR
jgi:hypothetical protein